MAAQAKTTGDLTLFCWLIAFPQCCLSSLSFTAGDQAHFFTGGRDSDIWAVSNDVGVGTDA